MRQGTLKFECKKGIKMDRILYDYKKKIYFSERTQQQVEIPYLKNFLLTWKEIKILQDKLSRRNMQIKDLKLLVYKIYQAIINKQYELAENLSCSKEAKEYINR